MCPALLRGALKCILGALQRGGAEGLDVGCLRVGLHHLVKKIGAGLSVSSPLPHTVA